MAISLRDYQLDAVNRMKNGCILVGGVGSGKSRTALAYYYKEQGGVIGTENYVRMRNPKDLYIITTARKRDTLEWEGEMTPFLISNDPEATPYKDMKVVVDSWNNIKKYKDVTDSFFIFDEQRLVGYGAWVKAFLSISKRNNWILLSATPADCWSDYIPVMVANGFYKNKTEFTREHVIYSRFTKYPKIDRYVNTGKLIRIRNDILVYMDFNRETVSHHEDVRVEYDIHMYKEVGKTKKDPYTAGYIPCSSTDEKALLIGTDIDLTDVSPILPGWYYEPKEGDCVKYENKPIKNASELCYIWRKIVNSDESRQTALLELFEKHPKMIIFYNYDYELDILRDIFETSNVKFAEWNGHRHNPIPDGDEWAYLVQYTAGAEGWNCVKTDTIVFYSQNYSYKIMQQAAGRIDRLNTPYKDLYYYHLKSYSGIDLAISRALKEKKTFNESRWVKW